ncbi:MAG: Polyketide cyclase / dehydrase and lipid transport [Chloroflexia bacterium]|nr:Polyketide cyclase / dehydrase and lipid transport [Chloroflexia bacterium]
MGRLTRQTNIDVPVETVFRYISNPRNAPSYISSITRIVSGPDGQAQEGSLWRAETNFLGRRSVVTLRLARLLSDSLVTFSIEGEPRALLSMKLESDGLGTGTHVSLLLDVPSVPDLFLNGLMGSLLSGDMTRLKRKLEG